MRYLSVCSGIEAATVAWHPLGWTPVAFSEIEPFPAAVLAHHYPTVPNYGDMTKHKEWPLGPGSIDLLVGGTPCQSFSVAGLRKGISDPRGGLMLTYLEIAQRLRPRWIVWENVPGVLSSGGGRDFGSFLGALGELGYGWAYRVLDAQWCRTHGHPRAVPQRRRRVFVVGCLGDGAAAAQVLFERESVQRDPAPRRASREGAAADAEAGARAGCWPARVASTLNHAFGDKLGLEDQHALNGAPLFVPDVVGALTAKGPTGLGAPEVDAQHYVASRATWWDGSDFAGTLTKQNAGGAQRMPDKDNFGAVLQPVGYRWQNDRDGLVEDGTAPACRASAGSSGFHEMNHPVVVARDNAAHAAVAFQACGDRDNPSISVSDTAFCLPANAMSDRGQAVAHTLRGDGFDAGEDGTGRGTPLVPVAPTLTAHNDPSRSPQSSEVTQQVAAVHAASMTVRRLTARECERLQAFPDDYTLIPWRRKPAADCPDGPRYKALGNSMAVNCMAWIGERIAAVEARND